MKLLGILALRLLMINLLVSNIYIKERQILVNEFLN